MRGHEASRVLARSWRAAALLALCAALATAGCASIPKPADPSYLPYEETLPGYPYGGVATVQILGDTTTTASQGELVAADRDSLFLFFGDAFEAIPAARLLRVRVIQYQRQDPVVVSFGAGDSAKDRAKHLRRLSLYARFPQGLPADLDRTALRPRPRTTP